VLLSTRQEGTKNRATCVSNEAPTRVIQISLVLAFNSFVPALDYCVLVCICDSIMKAVACVVAAISTIYAGQPLV
jgi:hypothetical protein